MSARSLFSTPALRPSSTTSARSIFSRSLRTAGLAASSPHSRTSRRGANLNEVGDTQPRTQLRRYAAQPVSSSYSGSSTSGLSETQLEVREAIEAICAQFTDEFWMEKDQKGEYPHELYRELSKGGWMGITMPTELGGAGLGIQEATVMLQAIAESGGGIAGAQSIHGSIYPMQPIIAFGTEEQKKEWLPPMIQGKVRSCFMTTEPNTGLDTTKLKTSARREGDKWIINGQKIWISSAQVAQRGVLIARTNPNPESGKAADGLSLFFARLREEDGSLRKGIEMRRIAKMGGRAVDANEVFFDNFEIPHSDLVGGVEGKGFKQILHGMNAERCLLAGEALGVGFAALKRATRYASERVVFGRPIGQNQAIQHPLADSWCQLEAAKLLTYTAARMYDEGHPEHGGHCNAAKYLAAEAGFKACERAVMTHGGMGYAQEYHVERYFREVLVPRIAPVSREMILNYLSQRVLGLPKSY